MTAKPEDRLEAAFASLEPDTAVRARVEDRVLVAYEAEQRSLAAEWMNLFRVGPVRTAARTVAAAASLLLLTPLGTALYFALM